jgi:predicted cation transporter
MDGPTALVILALLLVGPLAVHWIERNIEFYFLGLGILSATLAEMWSGRLVEEALHHPLPISIAVVVAGMIFSYTREHLDRLFLRLRGVVARPLLTAVSIFVLASISSVITAIIAALVLVEVVGLLRLPEAARVNVTVAGCFAIGLGAALTPLGEPLSTLATAALKLPFSGLFFLLAAWIFPGVAVASIAAGFFARGDYEAAPDAVHVRETPVAALIQGARVYIFVAGLILISHAFAPITAQHLAKLSNHALFWANTVSAALDNATLVALEIRDMPPERARAAILSLLVSGGMLVPGNIPNIISAGVLRIGSVAWARLAIPMGVAMLGTYFAVLYFVE